MSKLTRIIAIILFLAVGVLSFLPTHRISFAERPAEIPPDAADQLLDGLVKDAGGTNPISMHGLDSFAKKPGEEASTGLIVAIAIAVLALVAVIFLALGKAKAVPFLFGLLMLAALIIYWQVAKGDMLKGTNNEITLVPSLLGWIAAICACLGSVFSLLSKKQ